MKDRINWLDTAKCIGIFCIYLGHLGESAGLAYTFVFHFHVPLFFFLSGISEQLSKEVSVKEYLLKNLKRLLLPFYFFSLVSLVVYVAFSYQFSEIPNALLTILLGNIRNQFFAEGLWFLSCLFVIKILFCFLRKIAKKKRLIFLLCFVLFAISNLVFHPLPIYQPAWPYNIDSALYYIIYFALGYCVSPLLQGVLTLDNRKKKIGCAAAFLCSGVYSVAVFLGYAPLEFFSSLHPVTAAIGIVLDSSILIIFILGIARLLESVKPIARLGQNTLYLCGSEFSIKVLTSVIVNCFGFDVILPPPSGRICLCDSAFGDLQFHLGTGREIHFEKDHRTAGSRAKNQKNKKYIRLE